ncbi:hypothetical protein WICPIJ_004985 [Wickerhamomyces pijperi]|uniref:Uncharacterized protein n=1 Tax=Wickerhamomyces pijperi TaxID=599730 RepID=A0A9P8Q4E1_WICPI|nr:hypothetical protein WICPIJ_004985 [Wickerhamomyces pijperi]
MPENQDHISRDKRPIGVLEFLDLDDYYKRLLSSRKPKRAKRSVQQSQDCHQKDEGTQSHVQFTNQDNSEYFKDVQEDPQDYEDDISDICSISCSRTASTNSSSAARLLLALAG